MSGEIAPCGCMECEGAREEARARVSAKPPTSCRRSSTRASISHPSAARRSITIPLRIRVGVTADGTWVWITAEVPMPEVEQGEVAGEVER